MEWQLNCLPFGVNKHLFSYQNNFGKQFSSDKCKTFLSVVVLFIFWSNTIEQNIVFKAVGSLRSVAGELSLHLADAQVGQRRYFTSLYKH